MYLTEHCEFGETLDEMLRDRCVCGVRDIRILRRLLAEPKLTLKRALDLALAIEAADKDASEIQQGDSQEGGTSLKKFDKGSEIKCCYFKDAKFHACGKVGHLSRACQAKQKGKQTPPVTEKESGAPQTAHHLEGEEQWRE